MRGGNGARLPSIGVWLWGGSPASSKFTTTASDGTFSFTHGDGTFTLIVYVIENDAYVGWYSEDSPGGFTTQRGRATVFRLNGDRLTRVEIRLPADHVQLPPAMASGTTAAVPVPDARPAGARPATPTATPTPTPTATPRPTPIATPAPPARIRGTMLGPDGQPARGVSVRIVNASGRDGRTAPVSADGTFDIAHGNGAFALQIWIGQGAGGRRSVGWYGGESGFTLDREQATEIVVDGADVTGVEIRLPAGIRGTVLDSDGRPATAIGVQLEGESVDTTGWGFVAADGTFYIIHKDGTYTLSVFFIGNEGWRFIGRYGGESGLTTDRAQASLIKIDGADVTGIDVRLPADFAATPSTAPTYPEIVFVGEISPEYQAATRAAMEEVVAYYTDRFGVQAPTFSMFVGADPEAVQTVLSEHGGVGTVIPSGGMVTRVAGEMDALVIVGHSVVTGRVNSTLLSHEYFHILQRALANVSANSNFGRTPHWLVEGSATYEGILSRGFWASSYRDGAIVRTANFDGRLRDLDRHNALVGYSPGAIATEWLTQLAGESSQVDFWRLLETSATWQDAFTSAFGMSVDDFHEAFEEHRWNLLAQLPAGRVQGTTLGPDGASLQGIGVLVGREGALDGSFARTDPDGGFDLHVLDGALTIRIYIQRAGWHHVGWYSAEDGFTTDPAQATEIEVAGADVTGIEIHLPAGFANLPSIE